MLGIYQHIDHHADVANAAVELEHFLTSVQHLTLHDQKIKIGTLIRVATRIGAEQDDPVRVSTGNDPFNGGLENFGVQHRDFLSLRD